MAAVEVEITGNGFFSGAKSNLVTYAVTEDSTPIEASDTSGGTGQINFTVTDDPDAEGTVLLMNDEATLSDGAKGVTAGKITGISSDGNEASVTADGRLNQLVSTRQALPIVGTLEEVMRYYLGLGGLTENIEIDNAVASTPLTLAGWNGVIWDHIKDLCVATQTEITLVSDQIVVRPLRGRELLRDNDTKRSWTVSTGDLAQNIEINYYNSTYHSNFLVYPIGGWNDDVSIFTVDAGAVVEEDIELPVSLYSVVQPTCVQFVTANYAGPDSVYAVAGNDGLPITPAQWAAQGGSLTVSILPDTKSIRIRITGASMEEYAPYSIAVASGTSNYYSALRIMGTGVFTDQKTLRVPTGVTADDTTTEVGVTVDNFAINTLQQAYDLAVAVVGKYSGPQQQISVSSTQVNRRNDDGQLAAASFGEVDDYYGAKTFGDMDTLLGLTTFGQQTAFWENRVRSRFENQIFGNVNGARVAARFGMYRVRTANITESTIDYTAEADTIIDDANTVFAGMTFGDMDDKLAGKTFGDVRLIPLWD